MNTCNGGKTPEQSKDDHNWNHNQFTMASTKPSTKPPFVAQPSWKLLSQGAEAKLWKIPDFLPGKRAAVAKERFSKTYRHPVLDERLTKSRCKGEAKCLVRARRGGVLCPAVWVVAPPVIYIEFLDGLTVRENLERLHVKETETKGANSTNSANDDDTTSISDKQLRMSLAQKIGTMIAKLHNAGLIHGDLTTSNMMLCGSDQPNIFLIDFGLARTSQNPEEFAVDLYVLERALLSTHPELDGTSFLDEVLAAYKAGARKSDATLHRLSQVRMRGRKRECFG